MATIGDTVTLSLDTPGLSLVPAYYRWDLWNGQVYDTATPELDVVVQTSGDLSYTMTAVADGGSVQSYTGTLTVTDIAHLLHLAVSNNGGEYPYTTTVTAVYSDGEDHATTWTGNGVTLVGSGAALTLSVTKPVHIIGSFDDGLIEPQHATVDVWGTIPQQLAVSQITASAFRGRALSGCYTDFIVLVKNDGYSAAWSLGNLVSQSINNNIETVGNFVQYRVRVSNDVTPAVYPITFTCSQGTKTRTVTLNYDVIAATALSFDGIVYSTATATADSGYTFYVSEGDAVTCEYTGSIPNISGDSSAKDAYQLRWDYTSATKGTVVAKYGKKIVIDTTGYGGTTLTGYLVVSDMYGNSTQVELDPIVINRTVAPTLTLAATPVNPVTVGVPVILRSSTTVQSPLPTYLARYATTWTADNSAPHSDRLMGSVVDTSGLSNTAIAVAAVVVDDAGNSTTATTSINTGNNSATGIIVWNDAYGNKAEAGTTVHFYACGMDPDADTNLTFHWSFTNPVSVQTGPSAAIVTTTRLAGTKIKGVVRVLDSAQERAQSTGTESGTTYAIDDVLVMGAYADTGTAPADENPDCPTCSAGTVVIPAPVLRVTAVSPLYQSVAQLRAFSLYYNGTGIVSLRLIMVGTDYNCDTGWTDAPSSTRYTEYRDWSAALALDGGCASPFSSVTGTLRFTMLVRTVDGNEYSAYAETQVSLPLFTNADQGTITGTCLSGYCGAAVVIDVVAGYDDTTTNQSYAGLGLDPSQGPVAAQLAVDARAKALAEADLALRQHTAPYCTAIGDNCVCTAATELDAAVTTKWTGDTRTAAQAAVLEILAGVWTDYIVDINNVRYTFVKTSVATGMAKLCLASTIAITQDTYLTIVFDSSGSMNTTLTPLQTLVASNGKLYNALQTTYGTNYSTHVKIVSNATEAWCDLFYNQVQPDTVTPGREQIVFVFCDEDSNYTDALATTAATTLASTVNDAAKFDFYIGVLFAVTGSTPYVADRWNTLYSTNTAFASLVNATSSSTAQLRLVSNVTDGGTTDYYFGLIQSALASAGITIVDPDA